MWTVPPNTIRCLFEPLAKFSKQRPIARCKLVRVTDAGFDLAPAAGCDGVRSVGEDALGDAPKMPGGGIFRDDLLQFAKYLSCQVFDRLVNAQLPDAQEAQAGAHIQAGDI